MSHHYWSVNSIKTQILCDSFFLLDTKITFNINLTHTNEARFTLHGFDCTAKNRTA